MTELYGTPRTIIVRPSSTKTVRPRPRRTVVVVRTNPDPPVVVARTVVVRGQGVQGPTGTQGPPGPAGGEGFLYTQLTPAGTWVINHNLGRYVGVLLMSTSHVVVDSDVTEGDPNTVTVTFSSPFAGYAVLT